MLSFKSIVLIAAAFIAKTECSGVAVPAVAGHLVAPAQVGYAHAVPQNIPPYAAQISVVNRALSPLVAGPIAAPFAGPVSAFAGPVAAPFAAQLAGPYVADPYAARFAASFAPSPYYAGPVPAPYSLPGPAYSAALSAPYPYAAPFTAPAFVR